MIWRSLLTHLIIGNDKCDDSITQCVNWEWRNWFTVTRTSQRVGCCICKSHISANWRELWKVMTLLECTADRRKWMPSAESAFDCINLDLPFIPFCLCHILQKVETFYVLSERRVASGTRINKCTVWVRGAPCRRISIMEFSGSN